MSNWGFNMLFLRAFFILFLGLLLSSCGGGGGGGDFSVSLKTPQFVISFTENQAVPRMSVTVQGSGTPSGQVFLG